MYEYKIKETIKEALGNHYTPQLANALYRTLQKRGFFEIIYEGINLGAIKDEVEAFVEGID